MAEINYNNLYNQLKPMEQRYYDQQFSKNYVPGQENIMLSSQPAYEQMKSVYEAQQQVPETGFFDSIFGSASAAEPPAIPNLSYRNITPTFDLATGITNTKSAAPFINTGQVYQNLLNTDLVNQLIQENQMKTNMFSRPNIMDVAGGITNLAPLQNLGIDTSYGVANEPDEEQVEYLQKQKPTGIAKLFEFLGNIPTPFNLARRGLQSLRGFNQKLRGTTFGMSPTLKDYFQAKRAEKRAAAGADVGVSGGGRGSRRGDADIAGRDRGGFATDDTAGFF